MLVKAMQPKFIALIGELLFLRNEYESEMKVSSVYRYHDFSVGAHDVVPVSGLRDWESFCHISSKTTLFRPSRAWAASLPQVRIALDFMTYSSKHRHRPWCQTLSIAASIIKLYYQCHAQYWAWNCRALLGNHDIILAQALRRWNIMPSPPATFLILSWLPPK